MNKENELHNSGEDQITEKPVLTELDFFQKKNNKTDLSSHFKKFMKSKKQGRKVTKVDEERTPEFKQKLREKFLETAKKYLGVPYGARFWKEGEEHHNAPLYLDCCALIRQIVNDLRNDFGFHMEMWN